MADENASPPSAVSLNEGQIADVLECISDGFYAVDRGWRFVIFNRAAEEYFRRPRESVLGRTMDDVFPEGRGSLLVEACRRAMDEGAVTIFEAASIMRPGRTVELRIAPLRDVGAGVSLTDITERRKAQDEMEAARRRSEEILESISDAFYAVDRDWRFTYVNRIAEAWWGRRREDLIGKVCWDEFPQASGSEAYEAHMAAARSGEVTRIEALSPIIGRWVDLSVFPNEHGCSVYFRDITDPKVAEERMKLMINELNHRVKNSLAVVQGIARQTFAASVSVAQAREDFTDRLVALADAHDVITRENWAGANLEELIERAVGGQLADQQRFTAVGPAVWISPKTALSLALAFHELVTNAFKYGALSTPDGQVALTWKLDDAAVRLVWRESGGPPVTAPERRGFGSRLLEQALAADLAGAVRLRFEQTGLVCEIDAPAG